MSHPIVARDELLVMLKSPDFLLLDVRDPNETDEGIIGPAKIIPGTTFKVYDQ